MEQILAIPTNKLNGLTHATPENILPHAYFTDRTPAETNESLKQVIPYVYLTHGDSVLLSQRLSGGSESRLTGKYALGFGGHINPIDEDNPSLDSPILAGLRRELFEELGLTDLSGLTYKGLINLDATAVERVHVGLVYHLPLSDGAAARILSFEPDKLSVSWCPLADLPTYYPALEGWAQYVYTTYLKE